jgi:glyoxylase-like metal-dependent hydrolase (beta-lactamase superfamily II)
MELTKIKGGAYYIAAPTNVGVYVFKDKQCLLVDTCLDNSEARQIDGVLQQHGLRPKYIINTHSHLDHCNGNHYFQTTYPGCQVLGQASGRLFLEDPDLLAVILFSTDPIRGIQKKAHRFTTQYSLDWGVNKINDEKFTILSLEGHAPAQIGIVTPEKVCFLGDAVFSRDILEKYSLPYLYDIAGSLNTLQRFREIEADQFVVGHADRVYDREELGKLVDFNLENLNQYLKQTLDLLEHPLTREDLLENLVVLNNLELNLGEYHILFSTVSAFIKYFYDREAIELSIADGRLYWYQK